MNGREQSTMRRSALLSLVFLATALGAEPVPAVGDACAGVRRDLAAEAQRFEALRQDIAGQRDELRRQAAAAQARLAELEAAIAGEKESYRQLGQDLRSAETRGQEQARQEQQLTDTLRTLGGESAALFAGALPGAGRPAVEQALPARGGAPPVSLLPLLEGYHDLWSRYLARAAGIRRGPLTIYGGDGASVAVTALQVGLLGGVYRREGERGLLVSRAASQPRLVSAGLGGNEQALLVQALAPAPGAPVPVLLDLSDGLAVAELGLRKDWRGILKAGGLIVWPILLVGAIALLMLLERSWVYTTVGWRGARLQRRLPSLLQAGDFAAAEAELRRSRGPMRRVWEKGITLVRGGSPNLDAAMQEVVLAELPLLERSLSVLAVFAAVCPLLGLLGTVSGIIKTFDSLTLYGGGNPRALSAGISEALITTELGLAVAIPVLLAHAALARRARVLLGRMDLAAMSILETVRASDDGERKP